MIINVTTDIDYLPLFDTLHAYYQFIGENYAPKHTIKINDAKLDHDVNILYAQNLKLENLDFLEKYDLIFIDNSFESFISGAEKLKPLINQKKVFFFTASRLIKDHPLKDKFIWYPPNMLSPLVRIWYLDFNYPTAFDLSQKTFDYKTKTGMIYINGQNRSWRHHSIQTIKNQIPDLAVHNSLSSRIIKTKDAMFESELDLVFRDKVNTYYDTVDVDIDYGYYKNIIPMGINQKFGSMPPGYVLIDLYKKYQCIIFPESSWVNDDLQITEKIIKCFASASIPWPIGGRYVNQQYNEIGFFTAWNFLPKDLQKFDSIEDHFERYEMLALAVRWLYDNQECLKSAQAFEILDQNYKNLIKFPLAIDIMASIHKVIENYHDKK